MYAEENFYTDVVFDPKVYWNGYHRKIDMVSLPKKNKELEFGIREFQESIRT